MKVGDLKVTPNRVVTDNRQLGIQNYDTGNDYPQRVMQIAKGSGTIGSCLRIYNRFVMGKGFGAMDAFKAGRDTLGAVLRKCVGDYTAFGAFALHCAYNRLGKVAAIAHVPFEYCRLGLEDERGEVHQVAVNRDWLGIKTNPTKANTIYCMMFDPSKAASQIEAAEGGIAGYAGQIYYANEEGKDTYPHCIYEEVLTDGATQVACANIRYRNAKNGFMPFGAIVTKRTKDYDADNGDPSGSDAVDNQLAAVQGDVNAGKLLHFTLEPGDEQPVFIRLDGENYDGAFASTEESIKANIGEKFMQPPILRCEQVSNGFADDMMRQAYDFYNSVTEPDRMYVESVFADILRHWYRPVDLSALRIEPLSYDSSTHTTDANQ